MFGKLFGNNHSKQIDNPGPEIMGLRNKGSFELDKLLLKLTEGGLVTENIAPTQIIQAVGRVDLDDVTLLRFYTDDEAFLQVVVKGSLSEENIQDVKLFHYYNTTDISTEDEWDRLLQQGLGNPDYRLLDRNYRRVWETTGEYHSPVHMREITVDADGSQSETDQFTMLYEREIDTGEVESLFLSAEEAVDDYGNLSRCLVVSTGITLSPNHLRIHG